VANGAALCIRISQFEDNQILIESHISVQSLLVVELKYIGFTA